MAWENYIRKPAFVLGFHGTSCTVRDMIMRGEAKHLNPSEKEYDWLGHGIYFWEGDPQRAQEWAEGKFPKNPAVIGAIIDLGNCLDMTNRKCCDALAEAYVNFARGILEKGLTLPSNEHVQDGITMRRSLDCSVVNFLCAATEEAEESASLQSRSKFLATPWDTVRSPFFESGELYEKSGFRKMTHIQIAVRSTENILGYFIPIKD